MPLPLPLVVNMFAGPQAGKSPLAALIFSAIKRSGVPLVTELSTEFASELKLEGRGAALANQAYVLGEQSQRIQRMNGKADIIITDAPIILSAIYKPSDYPPEFDAFILWLHRRNPTYNVFVKRAVPNSQAESKDVAIVDFLSRHGLTPLCYADPSHTDAEIIAEDVIKIALALHKNDPIPPGCRPAA